MLRAAVSVVGLVGLIANVLGEEDVSLSGPSGLRVHCSRRGARITVYRSVSNDTSTGTITVSFSELTELDRDGKSVGGQFGGDFRHVFSAFDKQNFTVSDPEDGVLPNSNQVNASCLTVKAVLHQNVSAANATTFTGHVCAVKDNGTLVLGDENSTVSAGQLKFTVRVNNWDWTTDGKYLQLKIDMRIPYGRTISEERLQSEQGRKLPKKFSFGGGATANFSTQVIPYSRFYHYHHRRRHNHRRRRRHGYHHLVIKIKIMMISVRGVQYVHWVMMQKCIMVKAGETKYT